MARSIGGHQIIAGRESSEVTEATCLLGTAQGAAVADSVSPRGLPRATFILVADNRDAEVLPLAWNIG